MSRIFKTGFADSSYSLIEFDSVGRPVKKTSPGGKVTLTEYDARGRISKTAVDMNSNGQIDAAVDRITAYEYGVSTRDSITVSVRTIKQYQSGTPVTVAVSESDHNGLQSWNTAFNRVSHSQKVIDRQNAASTVTNTSPDSSTVVQQYVNGRLTSSTHSVLGATAYTYDEYNRTTNIAHTENAVNQETVYTYDSMGRTLSAKRDVICMVTEIYLCM